MKIDSVFKRPSVVTDDESDDNTSTKRSPSFTSGEPISYGTEATPTSLGSAISAKESGGDYKATNPNSSAAGKYQFLWGTWGDKIKKVTGVGTKEDFLNNPGSQERFYSWYEENHLKPEAVKIREQGLGKNLTDTQLSKLIHYRGDKGAKDYLTGKLSDKPEKYNMSISKYIFAYGGILPRYDDGGELEVDQYPPGKRRSVNAFDQMRSAYSRSTVTPQRQTYSQQPEPTRQAVIAPTPAPVVENPNADIDPEKAQIIEDGTNYTRNWAKARAKQRFLGMTPADAGSIKTPIGRDGETINTTWHNNAANQKAYGDSVGRVAGYYSTAEGRSYISTDLNNEQLSSSATHEATHDWQKDITANHKNDADITTNPIAWTYNNIGVEQYRSGLPENRYYGKPEEVHARIMEGRAALGLTPNDKFDKSHLEKLKTINPQKYKELRMTLDDQGIINSFNKTVMNDKPVDTTTAYAAYGGILKKYDVGGFLKTNSTAIGGIGTMLGDLAGSTSETTDTGGQALSGVLKGASAGLALGPVGAAVGGAIGLVSGIAGAQKAKKQKAMLAQQKQLQINKQLSQMNQQTWGLNSDMPQLNSYFAYGGMIPRFDMGGTPSKRAMRNNARWGNVINANKTPSTETNPQQLANEGADYTRNWIQQREQRGDFGLKPSDEFEKEIDNPTLHKTTKDYQDNAGYFLSRNAAKVINGGMYGDSAGSYTTAPYGLTNGSVDLNLEKTPTKRLTSNATHETTHQFQNALGSNNVIMPANNAWTQSESVINGELKRSGKPTDEYYGSPQEVHARVMQLRQENGLKPGQKVNKNTNIKNTPAYKELQGVLDDEGIRNVLNNTVMNDTIPTDSSVAYAKFGGRLRQFAYGGVMPEWEAEKGEVVQGEDTQLEDGKQVASDIHHVGGNTHENGGTLGTGGQRVFSQRMKLSAHNKEGLADLGIKTSGTIAEIALKLGKLKGKMEQKLTSTAKGARNTGALMLDRYNQALDIVFADQEEQKMPMFAYGGFLPKFQGGGPIPKTDKQKLEYLRTQREREQAKLKQNQNPETFEGKKVKEGKANLQKIESQIKDKVNESAFRLNKPTNINNVLAGIGGKPKPPVGAFAQPNNKIPIKPLINANPEAEDVQGGEIPTKSSNNPKPKAKPNADGTYNGGKIPEVKVSGRSTLQGLLPQEGETVTPVPYKETPSSTSGSTKIANKVEDELLSPKSEKKSKLDDAIPLISSVFGALAENATINKIKTRPDVATVRAPGYNYQDRSQGALRDVNEEYQSTALPDRLKGQAFVDKLRARGQINAQENARRDQYNQQFGEQAFRTDAINSQNINQANNAELNNENIKTRMRGEVVQGTLQNLNTIAGEREARKLGLKKVALLAEAYRYGRTKDLAKESLDKIKDE